MSPFGSEERRLLHAGRGLCVNEGGRHADRRHDRHPRDARLRDAALHHVAEPVRRALPQPAVRRRRVLAGPRRRVRRLRLEPPPDLRVGPDDVDARRGDVPAGLRVANAVLDAAGRRQAGATRSTSPTIAAASTRSGTRPSRAVGHLVSLAELVTLAGAVFVLLMLLRSAGMAAAGVRGERGRDLLHEIRASFYRKLFLAFVAVAVIPVLTLAFVARAYMTDRLRADVEDAAIRTTTVAQRVRRGLRPDPGARRGRRRSRSATTSMVGISRVIDQDVNVFDGPRLVATSERDLFASGLLPTRTPADVYRAIVLDRRATFVGEERAGPVLRTWWRPRPLRIAGRQRAAHRAADAAPARHRAGDRRSQPPDPARRPGVHPDRVRARVLDGRAHRRSR